MEPVRISAGALDLGGDRKVLDEFVKYASSAIADDLDGDLVFLARNAFDLDYTGEQSPGISFADVKDIHGREPAA